MECRYDNTNKGNTRGCVITRGILGIDVHVDTFTRGILMNPLTATQIQEEWDKYFAAQQERIARIQNEFLKPLIERIYTMNPLRIILKTDVDTSNVIYFLPDDTAREGYIAYFSSREGHGEADMGYFDECPHYNGSIDATQAVLDYYANLHGQFRPVKRVYQI